MAYINNFAHSSSDFARIYIDKITEPSTTPIFLANAFGILLWNMNQISGSD